MPMPGRFLSSVLIKYKGRKILMDCGEGTQVSMRVLKWGFKSLDIICISHGHGDHIFGLPGLISTLANSGKRNPLTIIGPQGIGSVVKGLLVAMPYIPYDIYIIEDPKLPIGIKMGPEGTDLVTASSINDSNLDMIISTLELEHSCPCIGYSLFIPRRPRFDVEKAILNKVPKEIWKRLQYGESLSYGGKLYKPDMVLGEARKGIKLSYITDTRPIDDIVDFIRESDLFICEGTYGDEEDLPKAIENKHMTFSEAGRLAFKAEVKELLLTHFSPTMKDPYLYEKDILDIFPNTIIGYDGFVKILQYR